MTAHTDRVAGLRHDRSGRRWAGRRLAALALVVLDAAGLVLLLA